MQWRSVLNGPDDRAGESLSDALDCSAGRIVKITMPARLDLCRHHVPDIVSDGVGFNDVMRPDGQEVSVHGVSPAPPSLAWSWSPAF